MQTALVALLLAGPGAGASRGVAHVRDSLLRATAAAGSAAPSRAALAELQADLGLASLPCMRALLQLEDSEATWPAFVGNLAESVERGSPTTARFLDEALDRGLLHPRAEPAPERVLSALHYTLLLSRATKCVVDAPTTSATRELHEHVRACVGHSLPGWQTALNPFEHVKAVTMDVTLDELASAREARAVRANFGHLGLPLNIVEAVATDALGGRAANARAGLVLARARPGAGPRALAPPATVERADAAARVRVHPPLLERWVDLYASWNGAFVSAYADGRFFAQALAPAVLARGAPDEFVLRRSVALYAHIWLTVSHRLQARGRRGGGRSGGGGGGAAACAAEGWASAELTALWGEVNARAADEYQRDLDAARALAARRAARTDVVTQRGGRGRLVARGA